MPGQEQQRLLAAHAAAEGVILLRSIRSHGTVVRRISGIRARSAICPAAPHDGRGRACRAHPG